MITSNAFLAELPVPMEVNNLISLKSLVPPHQMLAASPSSLSFASVRESALSNIDRIEGYCGCGGAHAWLTH
jgi:hypothetical protein